MNLNTEAGVRAFWAQAKKTSKLKIKALERELADEREYLESITPFAVNAKVAQSKKKGWAL